MDVRHAEIARLFDDCMEMARDELESQLYGRHQIYKSATLVRVTELHKGRNAAGLCRCCAAPSGGKSRCRPCQDTVNQRERAKRAAKKGTP
jgi:hypothetical protein